MKQEKIEKANSYTEWVEASLNHISASDRIKELATAIVNHSDRADLHDGHIYLWTCEILAQVDIIRKARGEWMT